MSWDQDRIDLEKFSKQERSLLLYLESRAVDQGGVVDPKHMNRHDFEIAQKWDKKGLIDFRRIPFDEITSQGTHFVKLSEKAWRLAHTERRARCNRIMQQKRAEAKL